MSLIARRRKLPLSSSRPLANLLLWACTVLTLSASLAAAQTPPLTLYGYVIGDDAHHTQRLVQSLREACLLGQNETAPPPEFDLYLQPWSPDYPCVWVETPYGWSIGDPLHQWYSGVVSLQCSGTSGPYLSLGTANGGPYFGWSCGGPTGPDIPGKRAGKCTKPCCGRCGDPIDPASGNNYVSQVDYVGSGPFPLRFERYYNSYVAPLRDQWTNSYSRNAVAYATVTYGVPGSSPPTSVLINREDGKQYTFINTNGAWSSSGDIAARLEPLPSAAAPVAKIGWDAGACVNQDTSLDAATCACSTEYSGVVTFVSGDTNTATYSCTVPLYNTTTQIQAYSKQHYQWRYTSATGDRTEIFDFDGKLLSITNREGLQQSMAYDGAGHLVSVTDSFGRALQFTYDSQGQLATMTTPAGGVYSYAYDANGNLTSVTYPDQQVRTYVYENANLPNALTGIIDENGARYATWSYNAQGWAISAMNGSGANQVALQNTYFGFGSNTYVTDAFNNQRGYVFNTNNGDANLSSVSGPACPSCGPPVALYDANGNKILEEDWDHNLRCFAYDTSRNLETARGEGLTGSACPSDLSTWTPAAGTAQRKISTQWHPTFRLPTEVAEPLKFTTYVYNGDGGATCGTEADGVTLVPGVLCSKTVQATTDANGGQGFGATPTGAPRVWTYTYNADGQVLTADGPRSDVADVTTYTYYADDDPDLGKRGNVATITDALGHVTQITSYNADGQPTGIVDPNGLTTTLAYDARQRLTSRSVGGETTTYTYDGVGQLIKVTLPDGSFLSYTYDAAHRLTGMQDNLGNSVAYTLDAMGNRTQEQVFDPANNLAQTRSRVYSNLNLLTQQIGAANQTTAYTYDNQGNVITVTDPLSHVTTSAYDTLNRLKQVTDPNNGVTQYAYNGLDQLTGVTDPRNLATTYAVDGLGDLTSQVSPDTGTTTNTYDAAGNLLTQTDAKGQVTTYAYDALNRVTSITFADGSKQTYVYDQGANGIGRLETITETDPTGQTTSLTAYGYDQHGRVISETNTLNAVAYTSAYSYDSAGRLAGMTYPDGRSVAYTFDALGRIAQINTTAPSSSGWQTQVLVQAVAYQPFGGVKSYTLGNGQVYSRSYDQDGRISGYTLGSTNYGITYDAASRITGITDTSNPADANAYSYDNLDRLTQAVLPSSTYGYSYDAVGNRLSKTVGAATDTYTYSATSNQLASITPASGPVRDFQFDANGSTVNDAVNGYAYDARGRLVQATSSAGTSTFQVNALGQRVQKTTSSGDSVFVYDLSGHLIEEADATGTVKRELLYLGDIPVGVVQ